MRWTEFSMVLSAVALAGCGNLSPVAGANVSASDTDGRITARALLGEDRERRTVPLAGAKGLTLDDQGAIDRATDASCAAAALTQVECDRAFMASFERRTMGDMQ